MRDRADFERYVVERSPWLLRSAYLLCRDWATAEDLLQTALAKAWFAWRRVGDNPDPYVYRILANTHASWWRGRRRREVPAATLPEPAGEARDEYDSLAMVGVREALRQALACLPPRQRAVIVLRYFAGLSDQEIAEILGCSAPTVRSQASRALARLRVDPVAQAAIQSGG
jgi:RNA polymerase sigma-70 factor (sigma-E family)